MHDETVQDPEQNAATDAGSPENIPSDVNGDDEAAESADAAEGGSGEVGLEAADSGLEARVEGAPTQQWQPYPSADDGVHHTVVGTMRVMHGVASP
jgi:hypothetical protein